MLPPLQKPTLSDKIDISLGEIFETGVDGIPYVFVKSENVENVENLLKTKFPVEFVGNVGLYTLKSIDFTAKTMTFKHNKTTLLMERRIDFLREHYKAWGMKKESENIKPNYRIELVEYNIEGKLSKNQVIMDGNFYMKINNLVKSEDGITNVKFDYILPDILEPAYPYKVNNQVVCWYRDIKDVWVRQAREVVKEV